MRARSSVAPPNATAASQAASMPSSMRGSLSRRFLWSTARPYARTTLRKLAFACAPKSSSSSLLALADPLISVRSSGVKSTDMSVAERSAGRAGLPLRSKVLLLPGMQWQQTSTTRPSPSRRAAARALWAPSRTSSSVRGWRNDVPAVRSCRASTAFVLPVALGPQNTLRPAARSMVRSSKQRQS